MSSFFFQILFLSGLAFVIGLERTFRFFFQYHKIKGSTAFFGGIFVVLFGYPLIGMIIEAYGFIVLFSGFFPVAINFLRRIPVIGTILNLPGISSVSFLMINLETNVVASFFSVLETDSATDEDYKAKMILMLEEVTSKQYS